MVPQLNASYKMNKLVLRSSLGRSIRQADFTERFTSYKLSNLTPGRNVGNPDLEAESSYNFDIGADVYLSENLQYSNTLFFRQSSNLIDYTLTNSDAIVNLTNLQANSDYLYAKNISNSTTWGNEFGLKYTQNYSKRTNRCFFELYLSQYLYTRQCGFQIYCQPPHS